MNLVLDEAEEVSMKRKTRKPLGALATPHEQPAALPLRYDLLPHSTAI